MNIEDVTAVICTKNADAHLEKCLESLKLSGINKIIAIDAQSVDRTLSILREYNVKVYEDTYKTLGGARSIAVGKVKTKYIFFLGPDNLISNKMIKKLIFDLENFNWVGIAPLQRIHKRHNYISKSLDLYKKAKISVGLKDVIGTPQLYKTDILKAHNYSNIMHYSDDTELCSRLNKLGFKVGFSDAISYEIGESTFSDIAKRWKMYGFSDCDFFEFNKNKWSIARKLKSLLSPINKDFIYILRNKNINFLDKFYILYFLIFILLSRYFGWITKKLDNE